MKQTLLDTDIFSEILKKKHAQVVDTSQQYLQQYKMYTISTITVMEIVKGLHKVRREDAIERFLENIETHEIISLTETSATLAGRIAADLERKGQPIGLADPMIAAIAIEHSLILATGNERHYQRIQSVGYDLKIVNWKAS
ncbi:MAG: PIN domain-containing protein [Chloroflexota bacterium]